MLNTQPACAPTDATCNQKLFLQTFGDAYFEQPFWSSALTGKDALRKRVQFALSELFVISSQDAIVGQMPRGVANYYDMLGNDAFTNYRQLLQDVTLSPMMGIYLSILANDKGDATRDPDENYAREVMQLLTIGLNQLNPDGTPQLDGGIQNLFNAGRCALVANTGTLIEPITKQQWKSGNAPLPRSLFSHFDQTNAWEAIAADGANRGWGGRMADLFESMNSNASFTCISTSGTSLFLSGQTAFQLRVSAAGALQANGLENPLFGSAQGTAALQSIISADSDNLFAKEYAVVVRRSLEARPHWRPRWRRLDRRACPIPPSILIPLPIS
jgi:uncharacterized protein (DUF1501 family)